MARQSPTHLIVVPSANPASKNRLTPYRVTAFSEVAERIITREHAR